MTRCVLYMGTGGAIRGFLCAGHAHYAPEGEDIVCAAVSTLTQTCVNALESVAHVKPDVRIGKGFLAVRVPGDTDERDAQTLLKGMLQGLRDIRAQYPDHIRLTEVAVSDWR